MKIIIQDKDFDSDVVIESKNAVIHTDKGTTAMGKFDRNGALGIAVNVCYAARQIIKDLDEQIPNKNYHIDDESFINSIDYNLRVALMIDKIPDNLKTINYEDNGIHYKIDTKEYIKQKLDNLLGLND